jgi:putative sterol carrier protein
MPTVKETFDLMPTKFKPANAAGINKTIQYEISGEGGGTWHAVIKDGTCTVNAGPAPAADLTITMAAQDWLDMIGGKLNGQMAFMSGKLKLKGDMMLAQSMQTWFDQT